MNDETSVIENSIDQIRKSGIPVEFLFVVSNEYDYEKTEMIIQNLQLKDVTIKAFVTIQSV